MIFDHRRYLSTYAVLSLVLLRVAIGWHFFREGSEKVVYDRHDGELRLTSSAEGFLTSAKGPLAKWYRAFAPDDHGWRELLAAPRRNVPVSEEEVTEQARWVADEERRYAEATKTGELPAVVFPPWAPYRDWAERIRDDWRRVADEVKAVPALSDEQDIQVDKALNARLQQLSKYLATQSELIAEYRHELWRLDNWRDSPEGRKVPFVEERIAVKTADTAKSPTPWISQVRAFESDYHNDLNSLLTAEQRELALPAVAVDDALSDPGQKRLDTINVAVTVLTIGVGVCLLLGFFTRLASLAGALFLIGVILSQPPWLYDAAPTMPQVIEFAGLLVLAGTGAGRWAGLDFFTYALFSRFRHRDAHIVYR
jgi:uncharacterized membrane protein YphA (DoxX/SURF4 family)